MMTLLIIHITLLNIYLHSYSSPRHVLSAQRTRVGVFAKIKPPFVARLGEILMNYKYDNEDGKEVQQWSPS